MAEGFSLLTLGWFLKKALVGIAVGYSLRVIEHIIWSSKAPREQNPLGNLVFSLMILPQSAVFGAALGYLLLLAIASKVANTTVLAISAYLTTALMAFIADDLRGLVRRISRW
jgi:hypothetical protein